MIFCCLSVGRYPRCLSDLYLQYLLVPLPSLTLYFRFLLNIEQFPLPLPLPTIAHVATSQAEHPELNRDTGRDPAHLQLMIYSTYWEVLLFTCSTLPQMQGSFSQRLAQPFEPQPLILELS